MIEGRSAKVSQDMGANSQFTMDKRVENVEFDTVTNGLMIRRLVQNDQRFNDYLDLKIEREKLARDFWMDIKKKLITGGIFAFFTALFSALGYAAWHWVKHT